MNRHFIKHACTFGLLLVSLSACTYIIPDDPSVPRYNKVLGDRHKPERNVNVPDAPLTDNGAAVNNLSAPTQSIPSPVVPVAENNLPGLPPVDATTQARAEQEMAITPSANGRHVPVENPTIDLAQNDAPAISSVPPRPTLTGSDTTQARMSHVQSDLEHERATSRDLKAQLATDAASEPSLATAPAPDQRTVPAEQTGNVPPTPAAAIAPPPAPVALPPAPVSEAIPAPQPLMAPPPPAPVASSVTYTPAPVIAPVPAPERIAVQEAPPPAPPAPIEPVRLTPPPVIAQAPAPIDFTPAPPAPAASGTLASGSFDPFATAPAPARATRATNASSDFLPPSRYASKR